VSLTALIITDNPELFKFYEKAFRDGDIHAKHSFYNTQDVLSKLLSVQPQILLIEAAFGDRAAWLLNYLSELQIPQRPAIFVCLEYRTPGWEQLFLRKGAMYVFEKSMSEMNIADCIMNLYSLYRNMEQQEKLFPELARLLRDCGFSPKHRGYSCIVESVQMLIQDGNVAHKSLTKKVYPYVARKQSTTPVRVEKNIRDAIRHAWEQENKRILLQLLGLDDGQKPPSNGKLLSSICERLREILHEKQHMVSHTTR